MNYSRFSYLWLCGILGGFLLSGCTNSARDSTLSSTETPKAIHASSGTVELFGKSGTSGEEVHGNAFFTKLAHHKLQLTVNAHGLTPGVHKLAIAQYNGGCAATYLNPEYEQLVQFFQRPGHEDAPPAGELSGIRITSHNFGSVTQLTDGITLKDLSSKKGAVLVAYDEKSKLVPKTVAELRVNDSERYKVVYYDDFLLCGVISSDIQS